MSDWNYDLIHKQYGRVVGGEPTPGQIVFAECNLTFPFHSLFVTHTRGRLLIAAQVFFEQQALESFAPECMWDDFRNVVLALPGLATPSKESKIYGGSAYMAFQIPRRGANSPAFFKLVTPELVDERIDEWAKSMQTILGRVIELSSILNGSRWLLNNYSVKNH